MTGKILALDLAKRTGWAVGPTTGFMPTALEVKGGWLPVEIISGNKKLGDDDTARKFLFARAGRFLNYLMQTYEPTIIAYEKPLPAIRQSNQNQTEISYGLVALMQRLAGMHRLEEIPVNIQSVKAHLAGTKHAEKEDMVRAVQSIGFTNVTNHDEADALGVYFLTLKKLAARQLEQRGRITA